MAENIIDNGMFLRLRLGFLHLIVFLQSGFQKISEWISICHILSTSFGVLGKFAPVVIWVPDNDRIPLLIFRVDGFSHFSWRLDYFAILVGFQCGNQPGLGGLQTLESLPLWAQVEPL